ncbi:KDP operon transcriptional regulatory protein KdpE [Tritonibacter multivorans]|uniref:KDP operon transcriptional regulatory protein KdpE n=1 Tax=Tritonibacter multivorans TaxID=928856 RepID=A0A0N7LZ60_9RHOB|nr:response regulator [Tritonibacter multivorans]MDA7421847.1 response regulator [Tritonibacter multivorans]CUH76761.1 KDP operon transcriptional regulatory protein KdpE [Tritonibacter multivorans]SFD07281.1 response regulator receiver protein [Tritonibacter multivorans]
MDDSDLFASASRLSNPRRPLLGLTVLVVEDSRYACEAMRLLCLRSGARIRRADCLKSANRHLQVYRPSAVVIDLGLPDGSGLDLIRELSQCTPRVSVILGMSGDDNAEAAAIEAGADGFLPKPVTSLGAFQTAILSKLPPDRQPVGLRQVSDEEIIPDRLAYRDDMAHAAEVLNDDESDKSWDYLAQFLGGVARSVGDAPLADAAAALAASRKEGRSIASETAQIAGLVQERLQERVAI